MTIQEIKSQYNIEDVIDAQLPGGLKRQGSQWVGNCPFHEDTHASLKISAGKAIFKCFVTGCGKSGDMFDFFTLQGKSIEETKSIITGGSITPQTQPKKQKPVNKWINAVPDQSNIPNPKNEHHGKYNKPCDAFWAYHNAIGQIIGFTCRYNLEDGKKDVLPYSFKQQVDFESMPLGNAVWKFMELDKPRPLYDLHRIVANPDADILLVEGEKTAEAAKLLYPDLIVTTWIGGSDNVLHTDWKPLHGRNILLWPDNDMPGLWCMLGGWSLNEETKIYKRITGIAEMFTANFKRVRNNSSFARKWDVADADWTIEQAAAYLKDNTQDIPTVSDLPPNETVAIHEPAPMIPTLMIPEHFTPAPEPESVLSKNTHFICLGFEKNDQNLYVFFVYRSNVIVKLSAGGITTSNILQLAPLNYWEGAFPKNSRAGGPVKFELNSIVDNLITACLANGVFSPSKIRGRGAWIDNGVPVLHCGDHLIAGGVPVKFGSLNSKYIYEAGQELGFTMTKPLPVKEVNKLVELLERLNWARPVNPRLLAGWVVIAPLCGALKWRPHTWLTGPSGSGKSEVMKLFVKNIIGEFAISAQSETTEAGIRQTLRADALPVLFDEAEAEDAKGLQRTKGNVSLARSASTSDSGKIIKGSSGGSANDYVMRSCIMFSSIGVNISQRADVSRITILELKPDWRIGEEKRAHWKETLRMYYEIVTPEFIAGFLSRAVMMMPVILKNAETFSKAASIELDNQRTGDQLGAMLSGAYSLFSDGEISLNDAIEWIKQRDWTEERMAESTRDEMKVLRSIIDAETTVETLGGHRVTRTIGELIMTARGDVMEGNDVFLINDKLANSTLKRIGIRVDGFGVIFSDTSSFISRQLKDTPYMNNYHTMLLRVEGAQKMDKTTFGSMIASRAVKIESQIIFDGLENPGISQAELNFNK